MGVPCRGFGLRVSRILPRTSAFGDAEAGDVGGRILRVGVRSPMAISPEKGEAKPVGSHHPGIKARCGSGVSVVWKDLDDQPIG